VHITKRIALRIQRLAAIDDALLAVDTDYGSSNWVPLPIRRSTNEQEYC